MNIHIVRKDGSWYARPDVTLVRDADRIVLPDDCTGALACEGSCIRIGKAGKAVEPRFASRYLDGWTHAVLFYGQTTDGEVTPFLDRATQVDRTFFPIEMLEPGMLERVVRMLGQISRHISLRIGDFLIFESSAPVPVARGGFFDNIAIL